MNSATTALAETVAADRRQPLDWRHKAVQPEWYGRTVDEVVATATTLDRLSTPMMTLDRRILHDNIAAMQEWCDRAGISLAPHGKTTMSPQLWNDQLAAGAWGISVANEPQLRVARGAGVRRVILANLFLRPDALRWLVSELEADPGFEALCWVDSVAAVTAMDVVLRESGARRTLPVLVELGSMRTGARSRAQAMDVANAVLAAPTLALAGVAGFEGSVTHDTDEAGLRAVDEFLIGMREVHRALLGRYETREALVSAGGSVYFDRVAAVLGPEAAPTGSQRVRVVLRCGATAIQDDGFYRSTTPSTRGAGPRLRSAMHIWARVISMPEPGLALLDAGKRDLPYDLGLPEVQLARRAGADGVSSFTLPGHEMFRTNDQHAYVRLPEGSPLQLGDFVRLGPSHPCTAFDKWSLIPVLDDVDAEEPTVVDIVRSYF